MIEEILQDLYFSDNSWGISLLRYFNPIEKVASAPGVNSYNLGTGKGYSVLEIVSAFQNATGVKIPYKIVERRPGDVAECYADPQKARRALG